MEDFLLKEKFLSDCPSDKAFWSCGGVIFRNVYELVEGIRAMNDCKFRYHVNDDNHKDDFAKWLRDVFDDEDLALRLQGVRDKERYADIIQQRIWFFENLN